MAYLCYSFFGLFKLCKRFCKRSRYSVNTSKQTRPSEKTNKKKLCFRYLPSSDGRSWSQFLVTCHKRNVSESESSQVNTYQSLFSITSFIKIHLLCTVSAALIWEREGVSISVSFSLNWPPSCSFPRRLCAAVTRNFMVWKRDCSSPTLKCTALPSNHRLSFTPALNPGGSYSGGVTKVARRQKHTSHL